MTEQEAREKARKHNANPAERWVAVPVRDRFGFPDVMYHQRIASAAGVGEYMRDAGITLLEPAS